MNFEIPFIESIYRKQADLYFESFWIAARKNRTRDLIIGVVAIFLGILIIVGKNNLGYFFIGGGFVILYRLYRISTKYNLSKKIYLEAVEKEFHIRKEKNENTTWEFAMDYFRYKDYKLDSKIIWSAFTPIQTFEKTVFFNTDFGIRFVLSEEEVGEENFQMIIHHVNSKIS